MLLPVVFYACLFFHGTDSLSAIKHGQKVAGEIYTACQHLMLDAEVHCNFLLLFIGVYFR